MTDFTSGGNIINDDIKIEVPSSVSNAVNIIDNNVKSVEVPEENSLNLLNSKNLKLLSTKKQCPICNQIVGKRYLNRHIKRHNGLLEKCNKCKCTFASLQNHKCRVYECIICNKIYYMLTSLRIHMATHNKVNCNLCNKSFKSNIQLLKHKKQNHDTVIKKPPSPSPPNNIDKPYICDYCSRSFKIEEYLRRHITRVHTPGHRLYNCDKCPGKYYLLKPFKRHLKVHDQDFVICERCNVAFTKTTIRLHCSKVHKVRIISHDNQEALSHETVLNDVTSYQCNICGKQYGASDTLRKHLFIHTGDKPYKCEVCDKEFRLPYQLKLHYRIHTGEKPHKCKMLIQNDVKVNSDISPNVTIKQEPGLEIMTTNNNNKIIGDDIKMEISSDLHESGSNNSIECRTPVQLDDIYKRKTSFDATTLDYIDSNNQNSNQSFVTSEESEELKKILLEWNIPHIEDRLLEMNIGYEALKYIEWIDILKIIGSEDSKYGECLLWKGKLIHWSESILYRGSPSCSTPIAPTAPVVPIVPMTPVACDGSKDENYVNYIPLSSILNSATAGQSVQFYFNHHNRLDEISRDSLVEIIVNRYLDQNIKITTKEFNRISDEIVRHFPTENKIYYYSDRTLNGPPKGKLYQKYHNRLSYLRKKNVLPYSTYQKRKRMDSQLAFTQSKENDDSLEDGGESLKQWLKFHTHPPSVVEENWRISFEYRRKLILQTKLTTAEILLDWPLYINQYFSLQCFDIDFQFIHNEIIGAELYNKWPEFVTKIHPILYERLKSNQCKSQFSSITVDISESTRDALIMLSLHGLFPPVCKLRSNFSEHKIFKPSIEDSQQSFMRYIDDISKLNESIEHQIERCSKKHLEIRPYILIVGPQLNDIKEFYIILEKNIIKFNNFVQCLDICFKIHVVLNLSFSRESELVWLFIKYFFYNIKSEHDKKVSPSVSSLITDLQ